MFISAVIEYLTAEFIESAGIHTPLFTTHTYLGMCALESRQEKITCQHLKKALERDRELNDLLKDYDPVEPVPSIHGYASIRSAEELNALKNVDVAFSKLYEYFSTNFL